MKRFAVRLAIFLLLGAILNVLIAWVIVVSIREDVHTRYGYSGVHDGTWSVTTYEPHTGIHKVVSDHLYLPQSRFANGYMRTSFKPQDLVPSWMPLEEWDEQQSFVQVYEASGWPMKSMRGGFTFHYDMDYTKPPPGNITFHPIETRGGLLLPNRDRGFGMGRGDPRFRVVLPLMPLWPGFIINTLLYALSLWLLPAVPRAVRHRYRILRTRCPSCGYPAGEQTICTECGKPLPYVRKSTTQA
jgi:hypothetical protein